MAPVVTAESQRLPCADTELAALRTRPPGFPSHAPRAQAGEAQVCFSQQSLANQAES